MSGDEPEETAPFTHRPYGERDKDENPYTSPSGPPSQPSGPSYVTPSPPPPPMANPPYGPPMPQQPPNWPPGWEQGWVPVYGAPLPGSLDHKGAQTSVVLAVISLVSLVFTFFCCVTLPGVLCAPFAWAIGAKAKREIDASPGVYGNRGAAQTGMVMGMICTLLGLPFILLVIALFALVGSGWSWV